MVKKWLGWAAFIVAVVVVLVVALHGNPDAPKPETTKTPATSAPPTSEPVTSEPAPTSTSDAYSRALTDAAWATYTDDEQAEVCGALIIAGPDTYASAIADNPDLSDVDPDVAADELTRLCNA
jgi:hypothetical protein